MNPRRSSRPVREAAETLFFSPLAWLKLQWFCHAGETEIGGFGISAECNPLYVEEFVTVRQTVTPVSVRFEDAAVADFFDACVDRGLRPERFARLWLHTHPGDSPLPSCTDEATFERCFGNCDWSVMFILGRTGLTYARLAFSAGPGGQLLLPVSPRWANLPKTLDTGQTLQAHVESWRAEYAANVQVAPPDPVRPSVTCKEEPQDLGPWWDLEPYSEELDGFYYEPALQGDELDSIL